MQPTKGLMPVTREQIQPRWAGRCADALLQKKSTETSVGILSPLLIDSRFRPSATDLAGVHPGSVSYPKFANIDSGDQYDDSRVFNRDWWDHFDPLGLLFLCGVL